MLRAIDHVNITVPRHSEGVCLHFYRTILGLPEIPKPPALAVRGGAWFRLGATELHISLEDDTGPPSRRHVCFLTDDLDSARHALGNAGFAIEDGGAAEGLTRFFIRDPAGNRIEIGTRIPAE